MKTCRDCSTPKRPDEFYARRNSCKACCIAKARVVASRHPERTRAAKRRCYERNREAVIERAVARNTEPSNAERRRAVRSASNRAHRKRRTEFNRRSRSEHQQAARIHYRKAAHVRKARSAGVEIEDFALEDICLRDGGLCRYCGVDLDPAKWHLDHVIPIGTGGPHTRANVVATCARCNLRKGSRLPEAAGMTLLPVPVCTPEAA